MTGDTCDTFSMERCLKLKKTFLLKDVYFYILKKFIKQVSHLSHLSPQLKVVISNFAPPKFRKVKPPEIGKVKPPIARVLNLG